MQRGPGILASGALLKSSQFRVYAALVAVQFFFATLPVAAKIVLREMSAPALALLRVAGAALLFVVLQRVLVGERVRGAGDYARLALYGLLGVAANQLLYITALTLTTATAAQTLIATGPALTLLVAIVLRRESATAAKWAGIALAASGALFLVGAELGSGQALGNLLVVLNVACFSVYLVISRDMLQRYHPLTVITWVFMFGALAILPWGAWALVHDGGGHSTTMWAALAWIIMVPSVAAYYLNIWALQRVEASVVSVFIYLQPVLTALLAVPILGERISARLIPAGLLIFVGVALTGWAGRAARRRAELRDGASGHDLAA